MSLLLLEVNKVKVILLLLNAIVNNLFNLKTGSYNK